MFFHQDIIKRLNSFVDAAGWTKADFARLMNKPPSNIHKYFNGTADIQLISYQLLLWGCNIIWLYTGDGDMFADNREGTKLKENYESKIFQYYKNQAETSNKVTEPEINYRDEEKKNTVNIDVNTFFDGLKDLIQKSIDNPKK